MIYSNLKLQPVAQEVKNKDVSSIVAVLMDCLSQKKDIFPIFC